MGVVQMNSNPLAKDFNTGSLLKFAFPTISMMLFMGLYTIVDTIFVSRFVNTNALSAINIVCPVINLIVGLGTMIATGKTRFYTTYFIWFYFGSSNFHSRNYLY